MDPLLAKTRKHNLHNPGGLKCQCCNPARLSRKLRRIEKKMLRRYSERLWRQDTN